MLSVNSWKWSILALGFCLFGSSGEARAATASPNGSVIPTEASFVDSTGATWTLKGGHAYKGAATAGSTADIAKLLYFNSGIYQFNTQSKWFKWNGTSWPAVSDPRIASKSGTDATSAGYVVDGALNIWSIVGGHIYENGAPAGTTADVTDIVYSGGNIYQKNSFGNYFLWNGKTATWPAAANPLGPTPPSQASMYPTLKYSYDFTGLTTESLGTSKTIDLDNTRMPGYKWYRGAANIPLSPGITPAAKAAGLPVPSAASTASGFSITDAGGVTALHISGTSPVSSGNDQFCLSTIDYTSSEGVMGNQWGGPSNPGFYVEARMAFSTPSGLNMMIPAVWIMQTLANNNITWPGDAAKNYAHNVEIDMMEYDLPSTHTMGTTLIDWFGLDPSKVAKADGGGFTGINSNKIGNVLHLGGTPANAQLNGKPITIYSTSDTAPIYHTIGALIIPRAEGGGTGHLEFYWDDVLYGKATYTANTLKGVAGNKPTPAAGENWLYAGVEDNPYGLVVEAGSGAWTNLQWVHVWQTK